MPAVLRGNPVGKLEPPRERARGEYLRASVFPHIVMPEVERFLAVWLGVALTAVGIAAAAAGLYLAVLAIAAQFWRDVPIVGTAVRRRLTVVVPAHNEADVIGKCLGSLHAQSYDSSLYDVVVIADNCSDRTAEVAAAAGAKVLVRDDPQLQGKGHALRWALPHLLRADPATEAVAIVDADSIVDGSFVAALAGRLDGGANVVQAEYLLAPDGHSMTGHLRVAAFLLFHRVRFAGRAALRLPCSLVGNGMLLSRDVLDAHPWRACTSAEDLEYSTELRLVGYRPVFAAEARLHAPPAHNRRASRTQRLRWEGGRMHVARIQLPRLLAAVCLERRWSLTDAALDLVVPPLGVLACGVACGTAVSVFAVTIGPDAAWSLAPWLFSVVAIVTYVFVGLHAARAPVAVYRSLLLAPALVAREMVTRLALIGRSRANEWERTERRHELPLREDARVQICGVPIDPIGVDEALDHVAGALASGNYAQICTVNLDYLVTAWRNDSVRHILAASTLNVPDGAPVVWLSRLLGHRTNGRTAGADLVPQLIEMAARTGARVFLLGGENGAAEEASRRLLQHHPTLSIAGVHEPPRAALAQLNSDEIVRHIRMTRTDILLVALGHPKQDEWIFANRARLPVSVAMGVGCTFDLIAGYRNRAPLWMQAGGCEWLYRLLHEPRRLGPRYGLDAFYLVTRLAPAVVLERFRRSNGCSKPTVPQQACSQCHVVIPRSRPAPSESSISSMTSLSCDACSSTNSNQRTPL